MTILSVCRALSDATRRKIVLLLLGHNYCVSALAQKLGISESAVSQHLKVLKEADLLLGEKRSYYMHYDIDREKLRALAKEIAELAGIKRQECTGLGAQEDACGCQKNGESCSDEVKYFCHGAPGMEDKKKLPMAPASGTKE